MDLLVSCPYNKKYKTLFFWKKDKPVALVPNNYSALGIHSIDYVIPVMDVNNPNEQTLWSTIPRESKDIIIPHHCLFHDYLMTVGKPNYQKQGKLILMDHLLQGFEILRPGGKFLFSLESLDGIKRLLPSIKSSGNRWKLKIKEGAFPFATNNIHSPKKKYIIILSKSRKPLKKNTNRTVRIKKSP